MMLCDAICYSYYMSIYELYVYFISLSLSACSFLSASHLELGIISKAFQIPGLTQMYLCRLQMLTVTACDQDPHAMDLGAGNG